MASVCASLFRYIFFLALNSSSSDTLDTPDQALYRCLQSRGGLGADFRRHRESSRWRISRRRKKTKRFSDTLMGHFLSNNNDNYQNPIENSYLENAIKFLNDEMYGDFGLDSHQELSISNEILTLPSPTIDPSNDAQEISLDLCWVNEDIQWNPAVESCNTSTEAWINTDEGENQNPDFLNPDYLVDEPFQVYLPETTINCSYCQMLRQIIHSNGSTRTKLEIHGTVGIMYHAVFEVEFGVAGQPSVTEREVIDFSTRNMEWIKKFLIDYGQIRLQEGFVLDFDSINFFYDVLCTNMNGDEMPSYDVCLQPPQPEVVGPSHPQPPHATTNKENGPLKPPKSRIAVQRERTRRLRFSDLSDYFHLPIVDAAMKLDICPTVLKNMCRKNGLGRWPYRKIKSIDRSIASLEESLRTNQRRGNEGVADQIHRLRQERIRLCTGSQTRT